MSGQHNKYERRQIRRYRIRNRVSGIDGASAPVGVPQLERTSTPRSSTTSRRHAGRGLEPRRREGARSRPRARSALSAAVGKLLAQRAKEKGITQVAFDRGGYLYHGRVKALADGARAGGLNF